MDNPVQRGTEYRSTVYLFLFLFLSTIGDINDSSEVSLFVCLFVWLFDVGGSCSIH